MAGSSLICWMHRRPSRRPHSRRLAALGLALAAVGAAPIAAGSCASLTPLSPLLACLASVWHAREPILVPGPRGTTFEQDAVGPHCEAPCEPVTRLCVRCQPDRWGHPIILLGTRSGRGHGDSHPRRLVVTGGALSTPLASFETEVYDNGAWHGHRLDKTALGSLLRAKRVAVSGEGARYTSTYRMDGARVAVGEVLRRCTAALAGG